MKNVSSLQRMRAQKLYYDWTIELQQATPGKTIPNRKSSPHRVSGTHDIGP